MYGVEHYIERAIKSVQEQSFKDVEILCVDDASPDKSSEIVERMAAEDPRIRLIRKPANQGLYMARFTGYQNARGEYITNLDSDDMLAPEALRRLYEAARQTDADVTVGNHEALRTDGTTVVSSKIKNLSTDPDGYLRAIQTWTSCGIWAVLFRTAFIKSHPLIPLPGLNNAEDRYAWTQWLTSDTPPRITLVPDTVYFYCLNNESLSRKKITRKTVENAFLGTLKAYELISKNRPAISECARRFLLLQAGLFMEQGAHRSWMSPLHPVMDSILTRKRMVELVGPRLGYHYYLCMTLPLYRKAAWAGRTVIRKIQHKI